MGPTINATFKPLLKISGREARLIQFFISPRAIAIASDSDGLGGWSESISDQYGSTANIENKAKYLNDVITFKYRQRI